MSDSPVQYRYAEKNARLGRSAHHFAPFEGPGLLEAYRAHRMQLVNACEDRDAHAVSRSPELAAGRIDALLRRFEVRGSVSDTPDNALHELQCAVRLWCALAQRCEHTCSSRDMNAMLKLGDGVARRDVSLLDDEERRMVRVAAKTEMQAVARLRARANDVATRDVNGASRWLLGPKPPRSIDVGVVHKRREFGMLLVNSSRSRAYLDMLARLQLLPVCAIVVAGDEANAAADGVTVEGFDNVTPVARRLRDLDIETQCVGASSVNDERVARSVADAGVELMVYSGPAGVKVKPSLLRAGVELLHVHAGRLPDQRGSTTSYYSLLGEGRCWASAILLAESLDRGAVVAQRVYAPPMARTQIDHGYDALIRADLLARVLRRYVTHGVLSRLAQPSLGTMHYVMHAVLRHVVVLAAPPVLARRKGPGVGAPATSPCACSADS